MSRHPLTLFIVKKSHAYNNGPEISNGLKTSAAFVVDFLLTEGFRAELVEAIDGNSIDALVDQNRPAKVVIEALWVTPDKMAELIKLHPSVKWTIRIHSETPFLAQEGTAVKWISAYLKLGIEVAFNSNNTVQDFSVLGKTSYLPNYYPIRKPRHPLAPISGTVNVGCFGAVRPLKNQLIQAFAAIQYAQRLGKKLIFHMNDSRIEQFGQNNLKNIQDLFAATGSTLVLHPWMSHYAFLELIAQMDICLQVSLSESFNIVSADAVSMGVPLVGSSAIKWLPSRSQALTDSASSIVSAMKHSDHAMVLMNQMALRQYLSIVSEIWVDWAAS